VPLRKGAGSDSAATESGARKIVGTGKRDVRSSKPSSSNLQPIHAELNGGDICTALGLVAQSSSPLIALCRALIRAGHDPSSPLHAYRGDMLCLRVRSIDEAARLEINGDGNGFRARREPDAAPPMRGNDPAGHPGPAGDAVHP
jgi:hypothetical protein